MLNLFPVRRRFAKAYALLLALAFAAPINKLAHASTLSLSTNCSASDDSLKCHLLEFLDFLYAIAGVLGFVLIVVIVLAVKSYRKSKEDKEGDL